MFLLTRSLPPLLAGRTVERLCALLQTTLLATCPAEDSSPLQPAKGLTCEDSAGDTCFIVSTFSSRGRLRADIAPVKSDVDGRALFFTSDLITASQSNLSNIRCCYRVANVTKEKVHLIQMDTRPEQALIQFLEMQRDLGPLGQQSSMEVVPRPHNVQAGAEPLMVIPCSAAEHSETCGHPTSVRTDKSRFALLLHVPHVRLLNISPHRCRRCHAGTTQTTEGNYFSVEPSDILRAVREEYPGHVFRIFCRARRPLVFSDRFLAYLLHLGLETSCEARGYFSIQIKKTFWVLPWLDLIQWTSLF